MIDIVTLYNIYRQSAWREYELIDKRMNWVYIANTVLAVGLGFIIQEQLRLVSQTNALDHAMADTYTRALVLASKFLVLVVPIAAIGLNIALWAQVLAALFTAEGIRKRWRLIRNDPQRGASELPYVGFGFRDMGPHAQGAISTSIFLAALVGFWGSAEAYAVITMFPSWLERLHLTF